MFTDQYGLNTHCQIPATTGGGKSKLTEFLCREHNLDDVPVFVLDAKATTYRGLLNYYARLRPGRPTIVINPSSGTQVTPIRFFNPKPGVNVTAHASRTGKVILNALGTENIADVQRYRRIVNMLATYCAASGKSILSCMDALYFHNRHLAKVAADLMPSAKMRNEWLDLYASPQREWSVAESTRNRLDPFTTIDALMRTFGLPDGLSISDAMEQEANILVNLSPSLAFPEEACRIVGAVLTSELLAFSFSHQHDPIPYFVYLDEVEMYQSRDLALLLELSRGAGLRITLINHGSYQFDDPRLAQAVDKHCRIKFVGAGATYEEAVKHVQQHHLGLVNQDRKKRDLFTFVTRYEEEDFEESTDGENSAEGFVGEQESGHSGSSSSVRHGTRYVPHPEKTEIGQEDYNLQEKISQAAEEYVNIPERTFRVIEPQSVYTFEVPIVDDYLQDEEKVLEFEHSRPHQFPVSVIDQKLKEYEDASPVTRTIKKPPAPRD
jgi:hypothetical protein